MNRPQAEGTPEMLAKAEHWAWQAEKNLLPVENTFNYLKDHGKDLLAQLKTKIAEDYDKISDKDLERLAMSTEEYKAYKIGYFAAMYEYNELKFKANAADRFFKSVQSALSYKKAEMSRISG